VRSRAGSVVAAAAILVAAGTAIALPGGGTGRGARPVLAKATAPLVHGNSADGRAVLTADRLKPGDRRSGEVTISNEGHEGALYLVAREPVDIAAPKGARLSERLTLTIADISARPARTIAAGPLATIDRCRPLGVFTAGESRTYRFTVAMRDGGPGGTDNAYARASARVDFDWLETAVAHDVCPERSEDHVELPAAAAPASGETLRLGDVRMAIEPGPYRFAQRSGTARVGVRCISSDTGVCRGRLELERRTAGQGRGIALAVGDIAVTVGSRKAIVLRLNPRAVRRIASTGVVPVRAHARVRDASGRWRRASYRDRLVVGARRKR
jgi:hypothetical protein